MTEMFPTSPGTYGGTTSPFGTENVTNSNSTATRAALSPPGFWMVTTGAHNTVRYSPDSLNTFRTLIAASSAGVVWSDGYSVDIYTDATGGTSARYTQILGNI